MSILIDRTSRVIVQGVTGAIGRSIASRMMEAGTAIVSGVTPGKGGETMGPLPIFDCCHDAVERTGANASFMAVPPGAVLDACFEAIDAGIRTIVIYCEGVPVVDAVRITRFARDRGATAIGPNAAGCISPGQANLSDLADANIDHGRVGIVSKSGTLTYEVADGLRRHGLGVSTLVCLGGDPVIGTGHADILRLFEADPDTDRLYCRTLCAAWQAHGPCRRHRHLAGRRLVEQDAEPCGGRRGRSRAAHGSRGCRGQHAEPHPTEPRMK
jgi:succinyl-CoA synthetase alpha subunit